MEQLILHMVGDYLTQSHWMAENKTKRFLPAAIHATVYSLPFLLLSISWAAFAVILITHFFIDRYRLARVVVYGKNIILGLWIKRGVLPVPKSPSPEFDAVVQEHYHDTPRWMWSNCESTGYPKEVPAWLSVWLLIAADNTLHLAINYCAIRWL